MWFICTFLTISDVEHLFRCLLAICMPALVNVYSGLLIFKSICLVFLMLGCMSCLYIWGINPLFRISFANIFSHSVGCLFVLLMVSLAVQKLLGLIRSHLFVFAFIYFERSKQILLQFMSKSVLPSGSTRI